ncbi:hypothetical protein Bpfe_023831, partial [Biomphalaria pfeifferi]
VPKRISWPIEKKKEVIAQLEAGKTVKNLAEKHNIPSRTIYNWKSESDKKKKDDSNDGEVGQLTGAMGQLAVAEGQQEETTKDGSPCKRMMTEHKKDDSDDGAGGQLTVAEEQQEETPKTKTKVQNTEKEIFFNFVLEECDWNAVQKKMLAKRFNRDSEFWKTKAKDHFFPKKNEKKNKKK